MGLRDVSFSCEQKSDASPEEVWNVLSSWERITEFWKGTREVSKIGEDLFQVRFAFPGTGKMKITQDKPGMSIIEEYIEGPFKGTKTTSITDDKGATRLKTEWNVKLSPMLMFGKSSIQKHFAEGTTNALKRISEASATEKTVSSEE